MSLNSKKGGNYHGKVQHKKRNDYPGQEGWH